MLRSMLVTWVLVTALAAGDDPLLAPEKVHAGGKPIDVSTGHATPYVIDWNGDGKKDLLVGQFDGGKLRIYLNEGTNAAPEFGEFAFLQSNGADASVPVS